MDKDSEKNIHAGHFKRLRERADMDFESLNEHQKLELLLSFTGSRRDVNPLAHRLLNTFGNLHAVFDAKKFELMKVEGVTERIATMLTLLPKYFQFYKLSKLNNSLILDSKKDILEYLGKPIYDLSHEESLVVALNSHNKYINYMKTLGSENEVSFATRDVVSFLIGNNASKAVIIHNHPSGNTLPSVSDILATKNAIYGLLPLKITLSDHIIVSESGYFSFDEELLLDTMLSLKFNQQTKVSNVLNETYAKIKILNYAKTISEPISDDDKMIISACNFIYYSGLAEKIKATMEE